MLPEPYERWFAELTGRGSPVESRSTCDDCAMLPGAPDLPPEGPFDPGVRCCTYHPHLAPHFVGGILARGTDAGRALVRARLAARTSVTPLGLGSTPSFAAAWERAVGRPGSFGRALEIRCPFYADARCTIWQHRGATCAAFHCKLDRGVVDAGLWNLVTVGFNLVERALCRWLLARQGLDAAHCDALLHAPDDAALDALAWGGWCGREEEYFLEAARLVEPLSWAGVTAIAGREVGGFAEALRDAVARSDARALPERVQSSGEVLVHLGLGGRVRLQHPSLPLDLLELDGALADRLARSGETRLADLELDEALAQRLLDWRVLVPVAPDPPRRQTAAPALP